MAMPKLDKTVSRAEINALLKQAGEASDLLKALSHETRLVILCLLAEGEKSVSEIEETIGLRQATVSQQLARLRFDRLVTTRREGRTIYYQLGNTKILPLIELLYDLYCKPVRSQQ